MMREKKLLVALFLAYVVFFGISGVAIYCLAEFANPSRGNLGIAVVVPVGGAFLLAPVGVRTTTIAERILPSGKETKTAGAIALCTCNSALLIGGLVGAFLL